MIVVIIVMKIHGIVLSVHAHRIASGAQITDVSQQRGIVTVMMIVETGLMNHQITASLKVGPASVICSHVIMGTAFLVSTYVMVIMIVLTIRMKMRGISAMLEHVMRKQNSLAKKIRCGTERNAYRVSGCVMAILIV
jgi:hypothetical protein